MINNQPTGPHVRGVIRQHIGWQKRKYEVYTDVRARGLRFKPYVFLPYEATQRILKAVVDQLVDEGYHIEKYEIVDMSGEDCYSFTVTVGV